MDNALISRLRERTKEVTTSLALVNVQSEPIQYLTLVIVLTVVPIMWSIKWHKEVKLDEVASLASSCKAVRKWLNFELSSEEEFIEILARASKDSELSELVKELHYAAATHLITGTPAAQGSRRCCGHAASDTERYQRLYENLQSIIDYSGTRLATGEIEFFIAKLLLNTEHHKFPLHREDFKIHQKKVAEASMESTVKSRLRELTPEIIESLTLVNAHSVATRMWSSKHLNSAELDEVMSCTENGAAATKLIINTYARGDESVKGFASALKCIEMHQLAEKLRCASWTPAAEGSLSSSDHTASHMGHDQRESESLGNFIDDARQIIGETDSDIMKLRSTKEQYLKKSEYSDLEDMIDATRKAAELIDIILKNERAVPLLAKSLRDIGRPELCNFWCSADVPLHTSRASCGTCLATVQQLSDRSAH